MGVVRCFNMESKAVRVGRDFPSQRLAVQSDIRLRLLELPYVCARDKYLLEQRGSSRPDDIMSAILPEAEQDDLPTGFTIVGHVGAFMVTFHTNHFINTIPRNQRPTN